MNHTTEHARDQRAREREETYVAKPTLERAVARVREDADARFAVVLALTFGFSLGFVLGFLIGGPLAGSAAGEDEEADEDE